MRVNFFLNNRKKLTNHKLQTLKIMDILNQAIAHYNQHRKNKDLFIAQFVYYYESLNIPEKQKKKR